MSATTLLWAHPMILALLAGLVGFLAWTTWKERV